MEVYSWPWPLRWRSRWHRSLIEPPIVHRTPPPPGSAAAPRPHHPDAAREPRILQQAPAPARVTSSRMFQCTRWLAETCVCARASGLLIRREAASAAARRSAISFFSVDATSCSVAARFRFGASMFCGACVVTTSCDELITLQETVDSRTILFLGEVVIVVSS